MKLLILDLDGTIVKTNDASNYCFRKTVMHYFGINDFDSNWNNYKYSSDIGIIQYIYQNKYNKSLEWRRIYEFENIYYNFMKEYIIKHPNTFEYVEGFMDFVSNVPNNDWVLAVFTGGFLKTARMKLSEAKITTANTPFSCAFDGLTRNDIFTSCLLKASLFYWTELFEDKILVGDSELDIKLSKDLNITMIGMETSISRNIFKKNGIFASVNNYFELTSLLKGV